MLTPFRHLPPRRLCNCVLPSLYAFMASTRSAALVPLTVNKTTGMIMRCSVCYKEILVAVILEYEFR